MKIFDITTKYNDKKLYNIIDMVNELPNYFNMSIEELEFYFTNYFIIPEEEIIDYLKEVYKDDKKINDIIKERMQEYKHYQRKLRIYSSKDVRGVEMGGALKNIIAFCAGISVGLNLGDNTFAALATRGLVEIKRLGSKMGAEESTFYGLTGLGDLIVTCGSGHSRNRRAGEMIGKGYTIDEARKEIGMVIESVDNIEVAYELSKKYNVEMPITESVYNVLYNGLDPKVAVDNLMTRTLKSE